MLQVPCEEFEGFYERLGLRRSIEVGSVYEPEGRLRSVLRNIFMGMVNLRCPRSQMLLRTLDVLPTMCLPSDEV